MVLWLASKSPRCATALLGLLASAQTAVSLPETLPAAGQPNFVIIFVDDMGYGDPACYGGEWVATPAMDRIAREGILANAGYVTSPNCAPSRHGLLTGAYQQRFGVETNADSFENMPGIRVPPEHIALPALLRRAGYTTGHIGVWNLTTDPRVWFDEVYSPIIFGADYFPDASGHYPGVNRRSRWDRGARDYGFGPVQPDQEYLTDRLGREAVQFIEANAGQPFFLYFASNAVHSPFHAKAEHRAAVAHIESEPLQIYAAMLLALDENIGHILDALDRTGVAQNTIVFLASDNGPSGPLQDGWPEHWEQDITLGSAGPFAGLKGQFNEGGIRIPYLLRWPAKLPAGKVVAEPLSTLDIYPTFAAAAGLPLPPDIPIDGINLLPYLSGSVATLPPRYLYWLGLGRARGAVRSGDWKLLVAAHNIPPTLYNLIEDPQETIDLTQQHPAIWGELYSAWVNFQNRMPPAFSDVYSSQRLSYQETLARGPRALHELPADPEDWQVAPGLGSYETFINAPPDGSDGPLIWFKYAAEPNYGSASQWSILDGEPMAYLQTDFFGNPELAFGIAPGARGGAAIGGSAGSELGSGPQGTLLLSFKTGPDVLTLATLLAKGVFTDDNPFEITLFHGFLRLSYRSSASAKTAQSLLRVVPNAWYTIALSWDMNRPTDRMLWMVAEMANGWLFNGTLSPFALGSAAAPFRVAGRTNTSAPFHGALQNLVLYPQAMDAATLQRLLSPLIPLQ